MARTSTNPKVLRKDLADKLRVEVAKSGTPLTPELDAKIVAKALAKYPRTVSEAPDGHYNHSNSNTLRALAGLVVEGVPLEGRTAEVWEAAVTSGNVTVIETDDDAEGFRKGDVAVGQYVVRAADSGQGHHVFRKGSEGRGTTVEDMARDLLN